MKTKQQKRNEAVVRNINCMRHMIFVENDKTYAHNVAVRPIVATAMALGVLKDGATRFLASEPGKEVYDMIQHARRSVKTQA